MFYFHQAKVMARLTAQACIASAAVAYKKNDEQENSHSKAIKKADQIIHMIKEVSGSPGVSVAVMQDGKIVWTKGFGFSDLENRVGCTEDTLMRVASISKSITMAQAARLVENDKIDLDRPIKTYVPDWKGNPNINVRQLASHTSGIRHYQLCDEKKKKTVASEFELSEYLITKHYEDVKTSLELFQNDGLCSKPGTTFLYSTHGWTVLSAAMEGATGKNFVQIMQEMFEELQMHETYMDRNDVMQCNRARYYQRVNGRLRNAPHVDNSYKWAGGGFVSTVGDLCHFGDIMLSSWQGNHWFLQSKTVQELWTPVSGTHCSWFKKDARYGLGWCVAYPPASPLDDKFHIHFSHTGGAIGASSVLLILPHHHHSTAASRSCTNQPSLTKGATNHGKGTIVAIICNLEQVSLAKSALQIAKIFELARCD